MLCLQVLYVEWGLWLSMLPLFTQPHIIAMPPTNEKSLTLTMVGLESPICYGVLNQKTSVEKEIT